MNSRTIVDSQYLEKYIANIIYTVSNINTLKSKIYNEMPLKLSITSNIVINELTVGYIKYIILYSQFGMESKFEIKCDKLLRLEKLKEII